MSTRQATHFWLPMILLSVLSAGELHAQTWQPGVSTISLGRFAEWPRDSNRLLYFEDDLAKRVHTHWLERTHKHLSGSNWVMRFGWTNDTFPAEAIDYDLNYDAIGEVWIVDQGWTHKTFAVQRQISGYPVIPGGIVRCGSGTQPEATYSVTVGVTGPGTWVSSELSRFYIESDAAHATDATKHGFSRITYYSSSESKLVTIDFAPSSTSTLQSDWDPTVSGFNFLVLSGASNAEPIAADNVAIPVMVSVPPSALDVSEVEIVASSVQDDTREFLYLPIESSQSGMHHFGLSLPFGVRGFIGAADAWQSFLGGIIPTTPNLQTINSMVCSQPRGVVEEFYEAVALDETDRVHIRTTTDSYVKLDPSLPTFEYATLPPLVRRATEIESIGVDASITPIGCTFWTKYAGGNLLAVAGPTIAYSIPAPPRHDVFAVRHEEETKFQHIAKQIIDHANYQQRIHGTDPFNVMNDRGQAYALGLVSKGSRESYIRRMRHTIHNTLNNASIGLFNTAPDEDLPDLGDLAFLQRDEDEFPEPGTNAMGVDSYSIETGCAGISRSFNATVWRQNVPGAGPSQRYPWDIIADTGTILSFLYQYLQWSGDLTLIEAVWEGDGYLSAEGLFDGMLTLHDWAWMGGSSHLWGGSGMQMDMAGAHQAGAHGAAGILAALYGEASPEAAFARYIEAKSMLPVTLRLDGWDEVKDHYKGLDPAQGPQMISGYSEDEPSGPMIKERVVSMRKWADWVLSGERVHPIILEVHDKLYGERYWDVLDDFHANMPASSDLHLGMLRVTWPEHKLFAFARRTDSGAPSRAQLESYVGLVSQIRSTPEDFGLFVRHVYDRYGSSSSANWYTSGPQLFQSSSFASAQTYRIGLPVYPAMLETETAQVRIGGWGAGEISDAYVTQSNELVVETPSGGDPVTLYVQHDLIDDTFGGSSNFHERWKTVKWTIPGGSTSVLALGGGNITIGTPEVEQPRTNQFSYGDFTNLGSGGTNVEYGWVGPESESSHAAVRNPGDRGGDVKALMLYHELADSPAGYESTYAYQAAYLLDEGATTESVYPYRLSFDYKVASPDTRLQLYLIDRDDRSGFKTGSERDYPSSGLPLDSFLNGSASSSFSPAVNVFVREDGLAGSESPCQAAGTFDFEQPGEWRAFEVRGFWRNDGPQALEPGALHVQFSPLFNHCEADGSEMEVWIDNVVLEKFDSLDDPTYGFAGFRAPSGGEAVGAGDVVRIAVHPDERVPLRSSGLWSIRDEVSGSQSQDPAELQRSFSWWDDSSATWNVIPRSELVYTTSSWAASGVCDWERPVEWDYAGPSRLKVEYWQYEQGGQVLKGSRLSEWFVFAPPALSFTNTSDESGIDFSGKVPYALLTLNYDEASSTDAGEDLLVSFVGDAVRPALYRNNTDELADYATFESGAFDNMPQSFFDARGLSATKLSDGLAEVVLISSPQDGAVLFAVEERSGTWTLSSNITLSSGPTDTRDLFPATVNIAGAGAEDPLAAVWAGSWGKRDSGEPIPALYLARANDVSATDSTGVPTPDEIDGEGRIDLLFEWNPISEQFQDITQQALPHLGPSETIAATWGRLVGGDKLPDLYVAHLGRHDSEGSPGWSPLYENIEDPANPNRRIFRDRSGAGTGNPLDPELEDSAGLAGLSSGGGAPVALIGRFGSVTGARLVDVNADRLLDLALSRKFDSESTSELNLAILLNDPTDGLWERLETGPLSERRFQDIEVADLDRNGVLDLIAFPAPSDPDPSIGLYLGWKTAGGNPLFTTQNAAAVGIPAGAAQGATVHDFDGDGLTDVVLAREQADGSTGKDYFYTQDDPPGGVINEQIRISVETNGSGNAEHGLGALVTVKDGSEVLLSYLIDGGSGRGTQGPRSRLVGIGERSSADVYVLYEDGYEQGPMSTSAGSHVTITDDHYPVESGTHTIASPSFSYTPSSGSTTWTFKWVVEHSASRHEVEIWENGGQGNCDVVPQGQGSLTLKAGDAGVSVIVRPLTNGNFEVTLKWTRTCEAPCNYKFRAKSFSASRLSQSAQINFSLPICGEIQG